CHQVLDGAGDEHLGGRGGRYYPRPDVHGDAPYVVVRQFALARMKAGPDLDPERANLIADRAGAVDRTGGSIEGRQAAVPHRVGLSAPMPLEFSSDDPVVRVEERAPRTIAQCRGPPGRTHDIGEEDGGEDPV